MIDSLFNELASLYGARFLNQWPASMVDSVKAAWTRELREWLENPEAIQYALDNLPSDHVPMALEIRDLCRRYARPSVQLPAPPMSDEERARAVAVLKGFQRPGPTDARDWARVLRRREMAGERLTLYQRDAWRVALNSQE